MMSAITIGILAVSMSIDAFIASLGRGADAKRACLRRALQTGMVFGAIETLTPLIGWVLGMAAAQYIALFDHWIAFGLLGAVGLRMILQAVDRKPEDQPRPASSWGLIATAVGTSIDAMAVGVSLAFLDVNILLIALTIGLATTLMSTAGFMAGRILGSRFGRVAEVLGGLALIGLGGTILFQHLSAG